MVHQSYCIEVVILLCCLLLSDCPVSNKRILLYWTRLAWTNELTSTFLAGDYYIRFDIKKKKEEEKERERERKTLASWFLISYTTSTQTTSVLRHERQNIMMQLALLISYYSISILLAIRAARRDCNKEIGRNTIPLFTTLNLCF